MNPTQAALKPYEYAISAQKSGNSTQSLLKMTEDVISKLNNLEEPIKRLNHELYLIESSANNLESISYDQSYIHKVNQYNELSAQYQDLQNEYQLILTSAIHYKTTNITKHNNKWKSLLSLPGTPFSNPIKINKDEFIFAIYNEHVLLNYNAIYCYNTRTNLWREFLTYPKGFKISQDSPISYNSKTNELYLTNGLINNENNLMWDSHAKFAKIDLNSSPPKWEFYTSSRHEFAGSTRLINDELHLFGGGNNTKHRICAIKDHDDTDEKGTHFEEEVELKTKDIYDFGEEGANEWILGNVQHGLVHIADADQDRVILFGGMNIPNYPKAFDTFWDYDLSTKEWNKMYGMKLPYKMYGFGHILSADQRVIITFGGGREKDSGDDGYEFMDEIYVINIDKQEIRQSEIKCPKQGIFHAVSMVDENKQLTRGYIREHAIIKSGLQIPMDIMNLMNEFYVEENIHILHRETCRHWKINITEIIDNCL